MTLYVVQAKWADSWTELESYETLIEAEKNASNNEHGCIVNAYTEFRIIMRETVDTVLT